MQLRGGCTAHKQRNRKSTLLHHCCKSAHFFERRCDKTAHYHHIHILGNGTLNDSLGRHHYAEVDYLKTIAAHNHAHNILANVVHIALHGGNHSATGFLCLALALTVGLDERIEPRHSLLHGAGTLHHLRKEEFALAKEFAHVVHTGHERSVNHSKCRTFHPVALIEYSLYALGDAAHNHHLEPLVCGKRSKVIGCRVSRHGCSALLQRVGKSHQTVGSLLVAVENHIFNGNAQLGGNILIGHQCTGIHNSHIKTNGNGMEKEGRVHRLAHEIVATEGKRQVAHTATHLCTGQVLLYPLHGTDKVGCIIAMLGNSGGYGKHIGVENYILGIEIDFIHKNIVGTAAHGNLPLKCVGLPLLIKCHHHHSSTHAAHIISLAAENVFTVFKADGIYYAFALQTFEPGANHVPVR